MPVLAESSGMSVRRFCLTLIVPLVALVPSAAQAYRVQAITGVSATATTASGMTVYAYSRLVADVSDSGPLGTPFPTLDLPSTLVVTDQAGDVICVAEPLDSFTSDPLGLVVVVSSTDPGCSAELQWLASGPPLPDPPVIGEAGGSIAITTPSTVTGTLRGAMFSAPGSASRNVALYAFVP